MADQKITLILFLILIITGSLVYVFIQNNEIKTLQLNYQQLDINFQDLQDVNSQLNQEILILKAEKRLLSNQSELLKEKVGLLEEDIYAATKLIDFYSATINESIQWFRQNNHLKNVDAEDIQDQLEYYCLIMTPIACQIKLGCLPFINEVQNEIMYEPDIAVGRADYLKNLSLILESKGGDCEDISLLFVAEYNYLVDECLENGYAREQIKLYSYVDDRILKYIVASDNATGVEWFIKNARAVEVSDGKSYLYTVCGTFAGQEFGHCVVVVSPSEIKRSSDVFSILNGAALVEPQNGKLVGYINDESVISLYDNGQRPINTYLVYVIILNNDMLLFNWQYEEEFLFNWVGYNDFKDIFSLLKDRLLRK